MSILSQQKYQRQRMVKYAANHSITETAIRYGVSRKTVYKWVDRYDGTTDSLVDHSHKPLNSPQKHTGREIKLIKKRLKKHKWQDLILAYQELVEKTDFSLDTDRQAVLVRPLYMNLLDEKQTEFAKHRLLQAVKNYRYRVGTGFLSTPLILDVLDDIDLDAAYKMLENEEMPGWLFMPKAGATTVWESWEGTRAQGGIASLDHYSKGAVLEWVFRVMCGVQVDGENHFILAPRPGGNLDRARVKYNSVFGQVESGWKRIEGKTVYTFSIPANCTAAVILPGEQSQELQSGLYTVEQ